MRLILLVLIALAIPCAAAQSPEPPTRPRPAPTPPAGGRPVPPPDPVVSPSSVPTRLFDPYVELALGFGGESVADLLYSDGEVRSVSAGQGGAIAAGVRVQPVAAVPLAAFASLGYKVVFTPAENANVRLSRFPVEVGLRSAFGPGLWAEGAYVRHLSTELHGDGFFADEAFDSSHGVTVASGWKWVGLRYTSVRYTAERGGGAFDASNVALTARVTLDDAW